MNPEPEPRSAPEDQPPALKKNWRFYAGLTALALALFMPLFALFVPLLGLSTAGSAVLVGTLLAGGPEVMILIAVALLGKEFVGYFKSKLMRLVWGVLMARPVSKARYFTGLTIAIVSFLPFYLYGYFPDFMPSGDSRIYILAGSDLSFVFSLFLMGGEFWDKLHRLFVWEGKS